MTKTVYRQYSFTVEASNQSISQKFSLDKNITMVKSLLLSSDNPGMLYYRGSQRLELNGEELFPDGFESKQLMSGIAVSPKERFIELGEGMEPGNGELKITYKDTNTSLIAFAGYNVRIILKCELK